MPDYIYLIHPFRHDFFTSPTAQEDAVMDAHYEYLRLAMNAGVVLLAGPCLDETFGVVVLQAKDEGAARAFMFHDPCVQSNVMIAELHPLKISMMKGK